MASVVSRFASTIPRTAEWTGISVSSDYFANSSHTASKGSNMLSGILILLIMVILGGFLIRLIIFPTPSLICFPIYLG